MRKIYRRSFDSEGPLASGFARGRIAEDASDNPPDLQENVVKVAKIHVDVVLGISSVPSWSIEIHVADNKQRIAAENQRLEEMLTTRVDPVPERFCDRINWGLIDGIKAQKLRQLISPSNVLQTAGTDILEISVVGECRVTRCGSFVENGG